MGGWAFSTPKRATGFADADDPSPEKVERRREADLEFLAWVKTCTNRVELAIRQLDTKGWKAVAIERRLKQLDEAP